MILLSSPALEGDLPSHLPKGTASSGGALICGTDLAGACFGALLSSAFLASILGIAQIRNAVAIPALGGLLPPLLWGREGVGSSSKCPT